jgi:hypothetical protein
MTDSLTERGQCFGMAINVEKTKVMRISRHHPQYRLLYIKKQSESAKYFNYLGSIITNDARSNHEIKSRIAWQKQHSTRRRLLSSKSDLNLRKKLVKCYIWWIFLYCAAT